MNRPSLQRWLRVAGGALAVAGVLFVVLRLRVYWGQIDLARLGAGAWVALFGLSLLYGLVNVLLGSAWGSLLEHSGAPVPRRWAIKTYGLSQIGKYIPGNIFQFAARQARGMAAGIPGWPLARSAAWELGLLAVCGALFGFLVLPLVLPWLPVPVSAVLFLLALAAVGAALQRYASIASAHALAQQAVFLFLSGLIFVALLALTSGAGAAFGLWLPVVGAYVVAWLAGLVTPGAPAGIGVRELVMLLLLDGSFNEPDLLLAVVLARLVTVLGDLLFFLGAQATPEHWTGAAASAANGDP